MTNPLIERGPDGRVRMEITQGTRPTMGPLRIGVLAARTGDEPDGPSARVQIDLHRDLGVDSPGTVDLEYGRPLRIDGFGEIELIDVDPPEPSEASVSDTTALPHGDSLPPPPPPSGQAAARILIELRPL